MNRKSVCLVSGFLLAAMLVVPVHPAEAQDLDVQGNLTMRDSTDSTVGNVLKQAVPFIHNFGANNTFIGKASGNLTMSGQANTGAGVNALQSNTTGSFNTASGFQALQNNTTGNNNTASGNRALSRNTEGSDNTATGAGALTSNTTGMNNTATGDGALEFNTTGTYNTATGVSALQNNIGSFNSAGGFQALRNNTGSSSNSAFGSNALLSNAGVSSNNNTALGTQTLQNNNTLGSSNTAIGVRALFDNVSGTENTAIGEFALLVNTTGAGNTAVGERALEMNRTGIDNTAIGLRADVISPQNMFNATAIGAGAIVNATNKIRLGNTHVTVVEGAPYSMVAGSDQKENFLPVDGEEVLKKIGALNVTSWNYIGEDPRQFSHYGPMGQEFFAAFGNDRIGTIGTPTNITSADMAGVLMIAVQALEKRTTDLMAVRAENTELKARIEALERRLREQL